MCVYVRLLMYASVLSSPLYGLLHQSSVTSVTLNVHLSAGSLQKEAVCVYTAAVQLSSFVFLFCFVLGFFCRSSPETQHAQHTGLKSSHDTVAP